MYPLKSIDSNLYFNDNVNKLIETQHHGYSPVSGANGSFNKSPPPRLLHKNSNISPYENIKCFNNSENSYNQDGQFYSLDSFALQKIPLNRVEFLSLTDSLVSYVAL
ncbi:unnamed protein product [Schistosoma mattheei]|uniref:Uncharacterized protein n=1 Tax=Schistosoma mattheei TaxID=31246 RepID=A0A183NVU2_9TREM|nr:unnamed protein product [Schistosoma mattheei]